LSLGSGDDLKLHELTERAMHERFKSDPGRRNYGVNKPHIQVRQSTIMCNSLGGDYQSAELCQSLGYQYAGNDRIPRKVAGQENFVALHEPLTVAAHAWFKANDLRNKAKRRPMGQSVQQCRVPAAHDFS
jgi:hypothetical protein